MPSTITRKTTIMSPAIDVAGMDFHDSEMISLSHELRPELSDVPGSGWQTPQDIEKTQSLPSLDLSAPIEEEEEMPAINMESDSDVE